MWLQRRYRGPGTGKTPKRALELSWPPRPITGHWGEWGGRGAGSADQTEAILTGSLNSIPLGTHLPHPGPRPVTDYKMLLPVALKSRKGCGPWEKSPQVLSTRDLIFNPLGTVVTYPSCSS